MKEKTDNFQNKRKQSIFYRVWSGENVSSWIAVFAHGQGEHGGRYEEVAKAFIEKGAVVYVSDHIGHGKSDGKRGCIMHFSDYIEDLDILIDIAKKYYSKLPLVLVGHSLGGLIVTDYAVQYPEKLDLVVLSSPLFKLKLEVPVIKRILGNWLSKLFPRFTLGNEIHPTDLSTNPENAVKYSNDSLVHNQVSTRFFTEMTNRVNFIHKNTHLLQNPILIMHGGNDSVLDPEGSRQIHKKIKILDNELKIWPGMYHEIFNEIDKQDVFNYTLSWIQGRLNKEYP